MTAATDSTNNAVTCPAGRVETISPVQDLSFPDEWYELATEDHFWLRWRLAAIKMVISALGIATGRPAEVLDIGCGHGTLIGQLEQITAWRVDGADLNWEALTRHAENRGRVLYYDILECHDDFRGAYDYVTLFDVLEHIEDTRSFVQAAIRHLKPGGVLFVGVPALQCLFSRYDTAAGHLRRYSKQSLRCALEDLGADVIDIRYWGFAQVPLLFARKLMLRVWGDDANVIRRGFDPPGRWFNSLMLGLMRMETTILRRPPVGSSLILTARRT